MKKLLIGTLAFLCTFSLLGQHAANSDILPREQILFDFDWKFALGHTYDTDKDFTNGTSYFSYFAKTGYGDGAAARDFDDRAWRQLDIPHDWCVELPFAEDGSHSHGYKAIGRNYPENSVGWYRKSFKISKEDFGKKISIEFEGVFRNSNVWVNGFYLGTEPSGYTSFEYNITDYLNYGGENVVAIRVDASMEEGWYYEGAGIYRHVYLKKLNPLHVDRHGTFVTTKVEKDEATINIQTTVANQADENKTFTIKEAIFDANGKIIVEGKEENLTVESGRSFDFRSTLNVKNPILWSTETPNLHTLVTEIIADNKVVDKYKTTFGIRTIKFDPDKGFFLNGKSVKIVGANNHKDHAGVGTAIPDALIEWRIKKMKEMGANGIRTSHDPASPAFLDACDKLGMLVMDENRLTGSNKYHLHHLEQMIKRDRNHPSIVIWSLGNEEWAVEGNEFGVRITESMQKYAQKLDPSRPFTTAISGGWDTGTGQVAEVMGYNYIAQGNIDEHHKKFPWQASIGTEDTKTRGTRGVYVTDEEKCYLQTDKSDPKEPGTEFGWNFYNDREFLSGLFYWTGFDYRGEPTPFAWPAVSSQFGIFDLCGFPKDTYYYLQSWWQNEPVMYMWPHWNWAEDVGKEKTVTVYSNCDQVELFLNKKSLGKKDMPLNGHLEWTVNYEPGKLIADGFINGEKAIAYNLETSEEAYSLNVSADKTITDANNQDVSIVTIQVNDSKNRMVPTANVDLSFEIEGPGKIIGVGNGNPSSHESDKYIESISTYPIKGLRELSVETLVNRPEVASEIDDASWKKAFDDQNKPWDLYEDTLLVVRGNFELPIVKENMTVNLFTKSIVENQNIYVNGNLIAENIKRNDLNQSFQLNHSILKSGKNTYVVTGKRFRMRNQWDEPNTDPGLVQIVEPAQSWKRKTFNGLAQVLVQCTNEPGEIILKAKSDDIIGAEIKIISE